MSLDNLPHREPFRFVTAVEELEVGRRGLGTWCLRGDEDFFAGHFPGDPVVPAVLLIEALAQVSGIVAFAGRGDGVVCPARLAQANVKFPSGVAPPAEIRLESILTREMAGLYLFEVSARVRGAVVATGSLVLAGPSEPEASP